MESDRQLVDQFLKSRSETAFKAIYAQYGPYLYQFSLRLSSHNVKVAEEMFQETWMRAIRQLSGFQWKSSLKTWLTAIMININKEFIRRATKEASTSLEGTSQLQVISAPPGSALDLEGAISALPAGYKQVLLLHDVHGYTHKEIGEMLNISEGTSKSQLFQARKAMRGYLGDDI